MTIVYSGKSRPSAEKICDVLGEMQEPWDLFRGKDGDINWGRATANTQLNPDISNSTNKRVMRELFREHEVPMPRLIPLGMELNGEVAFGGKTIVGRPDHHSKGRGFWKVTNAYELDKAIRGTRRKAAATHFMEYIEAPLEYRVHIFKGESIRMSVKKFDGVDQNNRPTYTTVKPEGPRKYIRNAAKKAVEALGLDFGAVDILVDPEKRLAWVLEVNAAPGLGGTTPKLYAETFRKWYENA